MEHPIDNIRWIEADKLDPNDYNPNIVYTPELKLLELSLLTQGWIQPILVNEDQFGEKDKLVIIDGFHRYSLCLNSEKVKAMTGGKVPCAVLNLSEPERMMLTIRINRAKGSHISIKMHDIVTKLVTFYGITKDKVAKGIGATKAEVDLLLAENVFKKLDIANHKYSKAWYPK
jgi:ParB-like chromosome segregation protein Spo0J